MNDIAGTFQAVGLRRDGETVDHEIGCWACGGVVAVEVEEPNQHDVGACVNKQELFRPRGAATVIFDTCDDADSSTIYQGFFL